MKYGIKRTKAFDKDIRLARKRGKDLSKLNTVVDLLASGQRLPERYHEHALTGEWRGHMECHVEPDWLLLYYFLDDTLVLTLVRNGTHSDLFK